MQNFERKKPKMEKDASDAKPEIVFKLKLLFFK